MGRISPGNGINKIYCHPLLWYPMYNIKFKEPESFQIEEKEAGVT